MEGRGSSWKAVGFISAEVSLQETVFVSGLYYVRLNIKPLKTTF